MKRIATFMLALVMILSLATTASAAMEGPLAGGSIIINNAVSGQDYSAYQILYLESYDKDAEAYAYKANSGWESWLRTQSDYVSFDEQGYVTWVPTADAAAFAKAAQGQLSDKTADKTAKASSASVALDGLNLGYYLVDTTLGSLCSLDTTNPTVTMEEKNEAPEAEKKVKEGDSWAASNTANIGDKIEYQATITVQAGAENYALHDTMSAGLTFNNDVTVTVDDVPVAAKNYTVKTDVTGYTFVVEFENSYIQTLNADKKIIVTYSATLNENAVVGGEGNSNELKLKYGDESNPSWTPDNIETTTYTYKFDLVKTDSDKKLLTGAEFELYTSDKTTKVNLIKIDDNTYRVAKADETGITTITVTDGDVMIKGLDNGTYYLKETKAPAGYNLLADYTEVKIQDANLDATVADGSYTNGGVQIVNQSGSVLPSTGGMGTTLFYVIGGMMMVCAAVLLVTKKRMASVG